MTTADRKTWSPLRESIVRRFELIGDSMIWWAWPDPRAGEQPYWIDFAIYSTCGTYVDHAPGLRVDPFDADEPGCPDSWAAAVPELQGFCKWDGCMQWWDSEPMHVDEDADLDEMFECLKRARAVAIEVTGDRA